MKKIHVEAIQVETEPEPGAASTSSGLHTQVIGTVEIDERGVWDDILEAYVSPPSVSQRRAMSKKDAGDILVTIDFTHGASHGGTKFGEGKFAVLVDIGASSNLTGGWLPAAAMELSQKIIGFGRQFKLAYPKDFGEVGSGRTLSNSWYGIRWCSGRWHRFPVPC